MVLTSLGEAFGWLAKTPLVWLIGIVSAGILLISYYIYEAVGFMTATSVALVLMFMLPAVLAGTYGIIYENKTSFSVFKEYALKGYFRCLLPLLVTGLVAWVFSQFVGYLFILMGLDAVSAFQIGMFIFVPVVFFCYFADITAVVNNLRVFQSLKDSTMRVLNGSLSVAGYYLINIALVFLAGFIATFAMTALAVEPMLAMLNLTEEELLLLSSEELTALGQELGTSMLTNPEFIFAITVALSFVTLIFLPLLVAYKACYFKRTKVLELPEITPEMLEPEGEYDEKGRWYKYK